MSHSRENASEHRTVPQHIVRCIVPILILAAGVGVKLWLGSGQQDTRPSDDGDGIPVVQTVAAVPYTEGLDIEVDGIVTPSREIQVAAEVGGRIAKKEAIFLAGSFVTKKTLLVTVDQRDYQLELQRSEQQSDQVDAELLEVNAEKENVESLVKNATEGLRLNQAELDRMENNRRPDVFSTSELDQVRKAILTSENAKQALENQLNSLQARRKRLGVAKQLAETAKTRAKYDFERTTITAPCDGVIVQDFVEEGSYAQKGSPLFVIEDTSSVEVRCNLKMEDLYWLWHQKPDASSAGDGWQTAYQVPRTPVTVTYRMAGRNDLEYTWQGELTRYDGIGLDERTRTVPCRIVVDQPRQVADADPENLASERIGPPALVRGMYVTAHVHARPNATFVIIPEAAVQPGKWVWRVRDDRLEKVESLPLVKYVEKTEVGEEANLEKGDGAKDTVSGYWIVPSAESRIGAGDRLVVTPVAGMRDGMRVKEKRT